MRQVYTNLESLQRCGRTGAGHALIAFLASLRLVDLVCLRHCRVLFSVFLSVDERVVFMRRGENDEISPGKTSGC